MLQMLKLRMHGYLFMNISSRFSSTFDTTVQAASSATFAPSGAAPIGSVAIFFAAASSLKKSISDCSYNLTIRVTSKSCGGRDKECRNANSTRSVGLVPLEPAMRRASDCAASKYTGSLSVTKACRGVFVRSRRNVHTSRFGASNVAIDGYGFDRRHVV